MKVKPWLAVGLCTLLTALTAADELRLSARQLLETAVTQDVRLSADGAAIEIERGVLYEDDGPAAGYCYGPNEERLGGQVRIKKELLIDRPAAEKAFFLVGPGGELTATINGRPAELTPAGKAGQYWQQFAFPPAALIAGKNEFVLAGSGKVWIARDQDFAAGSRTQTRHPNRSAKSADGGNTWSDSRLGTGGDLDGEYYVRVFLDQVRPRGSLTLDVLDAANLSGEPIAPAVNSVGAIRVAIVGSPGIALQFRCGTTRALSLKSWSDWAPLPATGVIAGPAGRYFQLRAELSADDSLRSPRLESLTIGTQVEVATNWQRRLRVVESDNPVIVRSSIPFDYEPANHSQLAELRREQQLQAVVAGAQTELGLIERLAVWSSQRWEKGHLQTAYPPWDAHEILKPAADGTPVGGFCQQYNVVFLQACESLGLVGRAVSLGPGDSGLADGKIRGGHEVVEIWSNQFAKWIYVDGNAAWYLTDAASGVPLSLRELRARQIAAFAGDEHAPVKLVRLAESKYEWNGLASWPPFLELRLIPRSNFLEQAAPLPLHQGMRGWFWTGHHVWTDDRSPASRLYGHRISQPRNWDWTLNQARIHLTASANPGELSVELDTHTPGLASFQATIDEQPVRPSPATFSWKLHAGRNRLDVAPRNTTGRDGVRSHVALEWRP